MVFPGVPSVTAAVCVRPIPRLKDGEFCILRASGIRGDDQIDEGYRLPIINNLAQVLCQVIYIVVELYANYDQDEADNGVEAHRNDFQESVPTNSFDIEKVCPKHA